MISVLSNHHNSRKCSNNNNKRSIDNLVRNHGPHNNIQNRKEKMDGKDGGGKDGQVRDFALSVLALEASDLGPRRFIAFLRNCSCGSLAPRLSVFRDCFLLWFP